jgi:sugar phosphate isomerase/epimerase
MSPISRREFLATAACSFGAAALQLERSAAADPLNLPMGIQLYSVNDNINADAPATLAAIAKIGYKEVEPAGFGTLKTASAFRKALDENGLGCPSAHLMFDLNNLQKSFDDANALGCRYATASVARLMILPPLQISAKPTPAEIQAIIASIEAPMSGDEYKRLADAMNTVGAAAKRSGLTFATHNHIQEFTPVQGKTGMDYLMTHTDPETVKFEFDTGWMYVAGQQPGDFLRRYPGRAKMLHLKDFSSIPKHPELVGDKAPRGTELGRGIVPNKQFVADAAGEGIEHIFVEQEPPFKDMPAMEAAKVNYAFLHSLS